MDDLGKLASQTKRVAIVHSFYSSRQPSGENVVVKQQMDALRRAGHCVELFAQRTDDREGQRLYPLEAAWSAATGLGRWPSLAKFQPDVVHVHNLFPNFGKQWITTAPSPVVTSLHNYRPLCVAGTFFREGQVCTDCLSKRSSVPAVVHGCYRGRIQSVPVAIGQRFEKDPMLAGVAGVISLSQQMSDLYSAAGVPREKLHILPHFLPGELDAGAGDGGDYWIYAGRLSAEKGILELVKEWPANRQLIVVGQGGLEAAVRAASVGKKIQFIAGVERSELMGLMRGAVGLVFPSRWFEGFGLVYMEAIAAGTPVLAWKPSVVASFVAGDGTGLVVGEAGLTKALNVADELFPALRVRCRSVFEARYTEGTWTAGVVGIYNRAINGNGAQS